MGEGRDKPNCFEKVIRNIGWYVEEESPSFIIRNAFGSFIGAVREGYLTLGRRLNEEERRNAINAAINAGYRFDISC